MLPLVDQLIALAVFAGTTFMLFAGGVLFLYVIGAFRYIPNHRVGVVEKWWSLKGLLNRA